MSRFRLTIALLFGASLIFQSPAGPAGASERAEAKPIASPDTKRQETIRAINNFAHEHAICFAYYTVGAECLATDTKSKDLSQKFRESAAAAYKYALGYGDVIGLSQKTLLARARMALEGMLDDMDKNCLNISVIAAKYGRTCRSLLENQSDALDRFLSDTWERD